MENKKFSQRDNKNNTKSKTVRIRKNVNSVVLRYNNKNNNLFDKKIKEVDENEEYNKKKNEDENKIKLRKVNKMGSSSLHIAKMSLSNTKTINHEYIISILQKYPKNRREKEIKNVANFLSDNYKYFQTLKKDSQLKVEKLAQVARIKEYLPGQDIIRFGEIGDKFYVVIEGFVQVFKPIFEGVTKTPNDFISYMKNIKFKEKDENKYLRIKEYNKERYFNLDEYEKMDPKKNFMKIERSFYIESLQNMGIYGEGFSFGEISLITNAPRNATIKCSGEHNNRRTILLYIEKESYDKALKEYQEKKLTKDISNFINSYPFCKDFTRDNMLSLFNCVTKINLEKGDYLFKQNDEDTNLYFVTSGKFEIYIHISLNWINKFMEYIINLKDNILGYLYIQRPKKITEIMAIINKIKKSKLKSPMIFQEIDLWDKIENKVNENNLIGLKYDEEKINDNRNNYKIKIQNIDKPELIGIENSFEFKNKFYTVQCISDEAEVKCINIIDFINIIANMRLKEFNYLIDIVLEKKNILAKQIINSMKTIEYQIISNLEMKYEHFLNSNRIKENEIEKNGIEEYNNKICSVIKLKGYKSGLSDILDEDTNLLDKKPSDIIKKYLYKHKEPSKSVINSNKKQELIDFVFTNKTKKIKREKDIYKNNKENLLLLKKLMKKNKNDDIHMKKLSSTQSNMGSFIINNTINNQSFQNSKSICQSNRNENSIFNNSSMNINEQKFTNSFLINSNYLYKKQNQSNLNKKQLKENFSCSYITYMNSKINDYKQNFNLFRSQSNLSDKIKSKIIKSAIINKNNNQLKKIFNLFPRKKQKIKENNSINISNINNSFLNKSDLNQNQIDSQKTKKNVKEMLSETLTQKLNKNNIFGTVDKNKKEFYFGAEFSHKIDNINKHKDEKLLYHYFPMIKK